VLAYIFALRYEYRWADGVTIKKPIEVSAPKYVEYLMDWIEAQLDDELIFPQKLGQWNFFIGYFHITILRCKGIFVFNSNVLTGAPFPPNFQDVVKTIFKRLFRVYAHIYHSHFQKIVSLKEEAHLNTCFKHFVLFTWVSFFLSFFQDYVISLARQILFVYIMRA
jgi:MOB kinase activator 1